MRLLLFCSLCAPIWLAWVIGLFLYHQYALTSIAETPWSLLLSAGLLFPLPVFGLWFYAGAASAQSQPGKPKILEISATSAGATVALVILTAFVQIVVSSPHSIPKNFLDYWPIIGYLWALYTIIHLLFGVAHLEKDIQDLRSQLSKVEQAVRETELEYLRSQLNPHFLFNALNSLATLTLTQPEKAHSMILELSEYLRSGILRPTKGFITLEKELEACTLYLNIEKMRFGDRLQHKVEVSQEALQRLIPQTLLQPIYENAIKYGVSENPEITLLTTNAFLNEENLLEIIITNPLPSHVPEKKGKGLGLRNIRQRLKILYQRNDLVEIRKDEHSFSVVLKIPSQQAFEAQ